MEVIAHLFGDQIDANKSTSLFAEGVLLVGAFSFVPSVSENTKTVCLQLLCRLLEEEYQLIGSVDGFIPDVLAGIGYALSSSEKVYFVRLLNFLLGNWVKIEVPHDISHALIILHLIEWVMFGFINARSLEKISAFSNEVMENRNTNYATFAVLMATAGALRASNRPVKHSNMLNIVSSLRISAEAQVEAVAIDLISNVSLHDNIIIEDREVNFLLHCLSLGVARSGGLSSTRGPLLVSLALALLIEVFPLRRFYNKILEDPIGNLDDLISSGVKRHKDSILFKEAGATTSVFCSLYVSANEEDKLRAEDLVWGFCHDIYLGHRKVALLLRGSLDQLLNDLEKIAESAFLMTVVFALAVTKHRLTSKFSKEIQMDVSNKILVSFSCLEYFRHIRLPEYMETIRAAVTKAQENESAFVSFVESFPSYVDLTSPKESSHLQNVKYVWSKDEVQTARILFYMRVIPTAMSCLSSDVFRNVVAATVFLYMGHPNIKVTQASHAVFSSFISSEKESDLDERISLKEQLVFYYIKRSLEAYPKITPFDGLGSGVSALVRHLPAGSPSIYYCIHSLAEKANRMCREVVTKDSDWWKNGQGESEPCKKILELLLRLISLVDIQVLPELMKLLAQLIVQLPKDGQNMVLNELYALVAESDDVTRKPTLVSWLQSLSYLCSQPTRSKACSEVRDEENAPRSSASLSLHNVVARL